MSDQEETTYSVSLTADELSALTEATYAVPTTGYGPANPGTPILTARAKLEAARASRVVA